MTDFELVFSADDSMMSARHISRVGAGVLLDVETARQRLQCAVDDAD